MDLRTAVVATKAALPQILRSPHRRVINAGAGAAAFDQAAAVTGPLLPVFGRG